VAPGAPAAGLVPGLPVPAPSPGTLARPPVGDLLLMGVALSAVSTSGPLIAACAAPSLAIAFWRNGMASAVLLPVALLRDRVALRAATAGPPGRWSALAGVLLALHFGTWIPSIGLTSVASATALVATQPVWAALLARLTGERLPGAAWGGIAVAVAGAALVTGADVTLSPRALAGDLLAVVGGGFAAAYMSAGGVARRSLTTTAYTSVCYSVCALALLATCLLARVPVVGFRSRDWVLLVLLTLGPQLLGHSVFSRVLRTTSPTVVSLSILFEVPGAALLAFFWLHHRPSLLALPGLALLVGGVALVVRASGRATAGVRADVVAETD